MNPADSFLDRIQVAEPCNASWDAMTGDDRKRFCGECKLHVYNLSAMRRSEAEALLQGAQGRVCGRFFRRPDGTLITQECGPMRRRAQRLRVVASAVFALLGSFFALGCGAREEAAATTDPTPPAATKPDPQVDPQPADPIELMGDICVPDERLGRIVAPKLPPRPEAPEDDGALR
jgi:hypothetical protein